MPPITRSSTRALRDAAGYTLALQQRTRNEAKANSIVTSLDVCHICPISWFVFADIHDQPSIQSLVCEYCWSTIFTRSSFDKMREVPHMISWDDRWSAENYGLSFETLPWASLQASATQSDCGFCKLLHGFVEGQSPDETFSMKISLNNVDVTRSSDSVSISLFSCTDKCYLAADITSSSFRYHRDYAWNLGDQLAPHYVTSIPPKVRCPTFS